MTRQWSNAERARFFDEIPSGLVVVDEDLSVVDHNRAWEDIFGDCRGKLCYKSTKDRETVCPSCPALATFKDDRARIIEQSGTDRDGNVVHYLVHFSPVIGDSGHTDFVAAITTDLTANKRLQREYQTLFENVPCFVAVINRDHRVVKANKAFRRVFGEPTGERCYSLYKRRHERCPECPVDRTFSTGESYTSHQEGVSRDGTATPYLVSTAPLFGHDGEVSHVIEMALDMTEHQDLQEQLGRANMMRVALVENSLDGILVFDQKERVLLANPAAAKLLGVPRRDLIGHKIPRQLVPKPVQKVLKGKEPWVHLHETLVETDTGEKVPIRLSAVTLDHQERFIGSAVIVQDLREIKELEHAKVEAERLAAVGQTVAGLAHGIKNILTGLEGGMYVTSTGLEKGNDQRVRQGWEMLERNMARISSLTRNLLAFSRGDRACPRMVLPADVVHEVVGLFRDRAEQYNITMEAEVDEGVAPAPLDPEGMHSCLANLVSNAMDACLLSTTEKSTIFVKMHEKNDAIIFEVTDTGCGMDCEVKQKAFTSFFTTKGKGGSGLGLLLARKIVQQHGGSIELMSDPGQGTTFRLVFERSKLPQVEEPGTQEDPDDR